MNVLYELNRFDHDPDEVWLQRGCAPGLVDRALEESAELSSCLFYVRFSSETRVVFAFVSATPALIDSAHVVFTSFASNHCQEPTTAKLTSKERKALKPGSFAEPEKKAYPIEDAAHARAALSRVSANGTPAEQTRVRAAVHKKFPEVGRGKKP